MNLSLATTLAAEQTTLLAQRYAIWVLLLSPLWWVLGFDLFIYTFVAGGIFLATHLKFSWDLWSVLLLTLIIYLVVRVLFYLAAGGDTTRTLAALNNAANLFIMLVFYLTFKSKKMKNEILVLLKKFLFLFMVLAITIVLSVAWALMTGHTELGYPTLLGLITPPTSGLLEQHRFFEFIRVDWIIGESLPRPKVLAPYSTAAAANTILIASLAGYAVSNSKRKATLIELLLLLVLLLSLTRSVLGGYLLGTALALWFVIQPAWRLYALIAAFTVLFIFLGFDPFGGTSEFRASSNEARFYNYQLAIQLVTDSAPILGWGVKPESILVGGIPLGSHSTLVSIYTKGGMVGVALAFILFFIIPITYFARLVWYTNYDQYTRFVLMRILIVPLVWLLFEDVDAVALNAALIGAVWGLAYQAAANRGDTGSLKA